MVSAVQFLLLAFPPLRTSAFADSPFLNRALFLLGTALFGQSHHAALGGEDDARHQDEAQKVDGQERSVGNHGVDQRQDGERTREVTADVEHIEGGADPVVREIGEHDLIEQNGNNRQNGKGNNALGKDLEGPAATVVSSQEQTHSDLGAVVDHGLHVDAAYTGEHLGGIEHDGQTAEDREGGQETDDGILSMPLLQECGDGEDVEGGGAELERECLPLVAPLHIIGHIDILIVGKDYLLVDLQEEEGDPCAQQDAADRLFVGITEFPDQEGGGCNGQKQKSNVEQTVGGGLFHFEPKKQYDFFKVCHDDHLRMTYIFLTYTL